MCGLLGGINIPEAWFDKAKPFLAHRGPDENGDYAYHNLYLYHTRLSVQDLQTGKQPVQHEDITVAFNGEIYNHLELREMCDYSYRTRSDAETIISLYGKFGIDCLDYLDGMFAIALFDLKRNRLILARDRAGEKPLYIYRKDRKFAFASELNALKSLVDPGIDYEKMNQYLRYCFAGETTPYLNVEEVMPGGFISIDIDTMDTVKKKWWSIESFYAGKSRLNFNEAAEESEKLLNKSIKRRIDSSDLEVGAFLSGGIDSGLITSIASGYKPGLKTFTVSFDGNYDESDLAAKVAAKYNTDHNAIRIDFSDLRKDIIKILSGYGEPFADSSAIPSYYISREAKKCLTVILTGDGADELYGGYRRYVPFARMDLFKAGATQRKAAAMLKNLMPVPKERQSSYNYLYRLADLAGKENPEMYFSSTTDFFEGFEENLIYRKDNLSLIADEIERINNTSLSGLRKIMCLDFNLIFTNALLVKMDIASMAHSLEVRNPFLSKEILEFTPSLNDSFKIKGITTKYLLRNLAKKYLPGEIPVQPKRGFEVPLKQWINDDLHEMVLDYLSGNTFSETFVKRQFIDNLLLNRIRVGPDKRAKMLWVLLALEIWYSNVYKSDRNGGQYF